MKAILTKYLPFTTRRPSRIKASAEGVKSKVYTCEKLSTLAKGGRFTEHQIAARIFAGENKWPIDLASGGLPNGSWAHCFVTGTDRL